MPLIPFISYFSRAVSSNPFPVLAVPVTMQWPRHSLLRLSGKKHIEGTTLLRRIFEKAWMSMCVSITNNGPIRRWHINRRFDSRNFMDRKRHRLVRKPVSKKRTWTNIFLQLFLIFRNTPQATFPKNPVIATVVEQSRAAFR